MYRVTYTYDNPSGAGPFKGRIDKDMPYCKGDSIAAPFGRATVVSCRATGKPLRDMTRAELERAERAADKDMRETVDAFIAAGRGSERPSETRQCDDGMSRVYIKHADRCAAIADEKSRRMTWHGTLHRIIHEGA